MQTSGPAADIRKQKHPAGSRDWYDTSTTATKSSAKLRGLCSVATVEAGTRYRLMTGAGCGVMHIWDVVISTPPPETGSSGTR